MCSGPKRSFASIRLLLQIPLRRSVPGGGRTGHFPPTAARRLAHPR